MPSSSSKPSIIFWLLLGSIAFNGLLGGLLISSKTSTHESPRQDYTERRVKLDQIVRYIPKDQRRIFLKEFHNARQDIKQNFKEIKHQERKILELASASELDLQALETEMSLLRAQRQNLSETSDKHLLGLLTRLDSEVRLEALEQLKNAPRQNKRPRPSHRPPHHDRDMRHHDRQKPDQ